jgi:hypothetical protein
MVQVIYYECRVSANADGTESESIAEFISEDEALKFSKAYPGLDRWGHPSRVTPVKRQVYESSQEAKDDILNQYRKAGFMKLTHEERVALGIGYKTKKEI